MSRRPRASEDVRVRRALLSMAPGGAIKSESPILRHTGQILTPRMGGGPDTTPPELDAMFMGFTFYETTGGDGAIYPVIPLPRNVTPDSTGLGDATGLPMCLIVSTDAYKDLQPPAGWTRAFEYFDGGSHSAAVHTLDSYAGESLVSTLNASIPVGLSGANYRYHVTLMVGATPGTFTATLGTPNASNLILADPGGTYRMQIAATQVRYDRTWTPGIGYQPGIVGWGRWGQIYSGQLSNFGPVEPGWQSKAQCDATFRDQEIGVGVYVPSSGGSNIPINIVWNPA